MRSAFFCKAIATKYALYEHILNAELVSPVVKVSCFLLRLLFYYLLHTTLFNLSISLKSFMFGTCMRTYFVLFFNSAKTNCMVSKNEAHRNNSM